MNCGRNYLNVVSYLKLRLLYHRKSVTRRLNNLFFRVPSSSAQRVPLRLKYRKLINIKLFIKSGFDQYHHLIPLLEYSQKENVHIIMMDLDVY